MKLKIEIACDNAAFGEDSDDRDAELARILRMLASELESGYGVTRPLRDASGNSVGKAELTEDES